ncbi:recombination protein O N-terminal domain-containing protein [Candidatus Parcubacteria bacterium]|nr:recombination protein O N-terminal domain-containing protein [Candidatus Parcubacteria bacterium]
MHKIHITEGLVLRKRAVGEANTLVWVLTPLGLIRASARSTRVPQSKLRYGLEPLTIGRYAFVRGKHEWRLTSALAEERLLPSTALGRVSQLVLRLVQGEEANEELFTTVIGGLRALAQSKEDVEAVEIVLVLRILSHLGYLPHSEALAQFVESDFSLELSAKALQSRSLLIKAINTSLESTGL